MHCIFRSGIGGGENWSVHCTVICLWKRNYCGEDPERSAEGRTLEQNRKLSPLMSKRLTLVTRYLAQLSSTFLQGQK